MIPVDKQLHLAGGAILAFTFGLLITPTVGLAVAVIAGVGKEVYDYYHPLTHTADGQDFLATAIGGGYGFAVMTITALSG